MKRILIVVTLALVVLCFVKGSEGSSPAPTESSVIAELNRDLDQRLETRLSGLAVAAQLSAWMD